MIFICFKYIITNAIFLIKQKDFKKKSPKSTFMDQKRVPILVFFFFFWGGGGYLKGKGSVNANVKYIIYAKLMQINAYCSTLICDISLI